MARNSLLLSVVVAAVAAACAAGCAPEADSFVPAGVDATPTLAAVGPSVVTPAIGRFGAKASALASAAGGDRDAAQAAWSEAMAAWQELESMQIGPAASSREDPGGMDLRGRIYSWPVTGPCRVDVETLAGRYAEEGFFENALVEGHGLDALEHLLFAGPEHACGGLSGGGPDAQWDALGEAGVATARAAYAKVLADEVSAQAQALAAQWAEADGGFGRLLADAGGAGSPYGSQRSALQSLVQALEFVRTTVVVNKVAGPLGLTPCGDEASMTTATELAPSGESLAAIRANLTGFQALFSGGDGPGLDDHLTAAGHGAVATAISEAASASASAAAAIEGSLEEALAAEDRSAVTALHDSLRSLSALLGNDLPTALGLQPALDLCGEAPAPSAEGGGAGGAEGGDAEGGGDVAPADEGGG